MGTADGPEQQAPGEMDQETREYLAKLRSAPAEQLVTEVLFTLLNAAQVKIGRRDARLFIDLGALLHEHARRYVSGDLARQVDQALGQLRLAQVQAEGQVAPQGSEVEPNDLPETPAAPAGPAAGPAADAASSPPPTPAPSQPSPASRLWVPGSDF
jgi:hypothetical protein